MYAVQPLANYELLLTFEDDSRGIFDVKPFLNLGKSSGLRDESLFRSAHINFDTVEWSDGLGLAPEMLHEKSRRMGNCMESKELS